MGNNAMVKSALTGAVLQTLMVVLGNVAPAVGKIPNFYALCGTLLAAIAGALFAKWSPSTQTTGAVATGGAIVGGSCSILGGVIAAVTGQWPGFSVVQLAFPAVSGAIGGAIGGLLGRMLPKASAA
jgi:hypothetical protein